MLNVLLFQNRIKIVYFLRDKLKNIAGQILNYNSNNFHCVKKKTWTDQKWQEVNLRNHSEKNMAIKNEIFSNDYL